MATDTCRAALTASAHLMNYGKRMKVNIALKFLASGGLPPPWPPDQSPHNPKGAHMCNATESA